MVAQNPLKTVFLIPLSQFTNWCALCRNIPHTLTVSVNTASVHTVPGTQYCGNGTFYTSFWWHFLGLCHSVSVCTMIRPYMHQWRHAEVQTKPDFACVLLTKFIRTQTGVGDTLIEIKIVIWYRLMFVFNTGIIGNERFYHLLDKH